MNPAEVMSHGLIVQDRMLICSTGHTQHRGFTHEKLRLDEHELVAPDLEMKDENACP